MKDGWFRVKETGSWVWPNKEDVKFEIEKETICRAKELHSLKTDGEAIHRILLDYREGLIDKVTEEGRTKTVHSVLSRGVQVPPEATQ